MLEKIKSIQFVMIVSFVSSLLLAFVAMSLKPSIDKNIILDKKQSILKSIDIDVSKLSNIQLDDMYNSHIQEMVIDKDGNLINNVKLSDIVWIENKSNGSTNYIFKSDGNTYTNDFLPIYKTSNPNGYIIPISGKGLWSTMKGYFAIGEDKNSTLGIVFYEHGETPGLGAEVDKPWFQKQFKIDMGKKIFNSENELVSIYINKKKQTNKKPHEVDGITGATVTSDGVTKFLKRDLERYKNFLIRLR
ncbi:NADH:ubiquinone reductase (Na(+)-transporting) subunit C [bacterium]|nr:NADH:ubiquinone reductase (Na(+)-transporting) subunit C [bacterium]